MRSDQTLAGSTGNGGTSAVILDEAGLDRLELVLSGAAEPADVLDLAPQGARRCTFSDEENTPLAEISVSSTGSVGLTPLKPLARGLGPQWDPALRHAAATDTAPFDIAFVAVLPPSTAEIEAIVRAAESAAPRVSRIIIVGLVSRKAAHMGEVGAAGLTRSLIAASDELRQHLPSARVELLILPWPHAQPGAPLNDDARLLRALAAYGAQKSTQFVVGAPVGAVRSASELTLASTREVEAAASGTWSQPAVVFFTGLSGSGKSTIARSLAESLRDDGAANVHLLDGDAMRRRVSLGLGFDRAARNTNVTRIAEAAVEVARGGGIAIAAPIAPFAESREAARALAAGVAPFYLIYVSTPLEICEARDRKGLYAKARAGEIAEFTGISSPYEIPADADLVIDASLVSIESAVDQVKALLSS
ncbi:MAG: adenylyl-sulfate kinase [Candidatus Limnocylindrus sp.]